MIETASFRGDDGIWFTDPYDGLSTDYNGRKAAPQLSHDVYRFDPHTGKLAIVADDFDCPIGLCFRPDEKKLYIIDAGFGDVPPHVSPARNRHEAR